jgi:hypothetical protein
MARLIHEFYKRAVHLPAFQRWAIQQAPPGYAIEFGVAGGASLRRFAKHRFVYGFDSFQGLPENWRRGFRRGRFACDPPPPIPNTEIIMGWFADTVPRFVQQHLNQWSRAAFVHIDCDLYTSTVEALKVAPLLAPGAILLFDELRGYPGWEQGEWRALVESRIRYELIGRCGQAYALRLVY